MTLSTFTTLCESLQRKAQAEFAAAETAEQLEALRVKYLGRKGIIRELGRML